MRRFIPLVVWTAVVGLALPLAVAGRDHGRATAAASELPIRATDNAYDLPPTVAAGPVTVTLENAGQETHHAQIARLTDGATLADLEAALRSGPVAARPLVSYVGGPGLTAPGRRSEVTVDLQPGHYAVICFVESADGQPHLAKGMIHPLEVVQAATPSTPVGLEAATTISLRDFGFAMPPTLPVGRQTWRVVNDGTELHEVMLFTLAPGTAPADVQATGIDGTAALTPVGGMQALASGGSGWVTLVLEPGQYVAICFVHDSVSGRPHHELGMVTPFAVEP